MLCKNCNKSFKNEIYCPECGQKLIEEKSKKKKNSKVIIIVVIIVICWFTGLGILAANIIPEIIKNASSYLTESAIGQWKEVGSNEVLTLNNNNTYELDNYEKNTYCSGTYSLKLGYEEKQNNSYSYQLIKDNNIYYTISFNETCKESMKFDIIKNSTYIMIVNLNDKNNMSLFNANNKKNMSFNKIESLY